MFFWHKFLFPFIIYSFQKNMGCIGVLIGCKNPKKFSFSVPGKPLSYLSGVTRRTPKIFLKTTYLFLYTNLSRDHILPGIYE
jgi:hypothetical protein